MPNDLNLLDHLDRVAVPARSVRRLMARRRRGRPRERRGIILVFVVVLLMLLAIMGTAYLAVSRADRLGITSRGQLPGANAPRLADRGTLDAVFNASALRVENETIIDLFNVAPGDLSTLQAKATSTATSAAAVADRNTAVANLLTAFRQEALPASSDLAVSGSPALAGSSNYYENYDAPGRADAWLSSLLPSPPDAIVNAYHWPWVGAPLVGELLSGVKTAPFFSDPRMLTRLDAPDYPASPFTVMRPPGALPEYLLKYGYVSDKDAVAGFRSWYAYQKPIFPLPPAGPVMQYDEERSQVALTAIPMIRGTATNKFVKNSRLYPGFDNVPFDGSGGVEYIAADADGDGVPDSGLMPVILHPGKAGVDRYVDTANGVVYFVGYRVVDNSAQINMTTAMTAHGDFDFETVNSTSTSPIYQAMDARADENLTFTGTSSNNEFRNRLANFGAEAANLGFYRSNVGLVELVQSGLEVYGVGDHRPQLPPMYREVFRLIDARVPQLAQAPNNNDAGGGHTRWLALTNDPFASTSSGQVIATYREGTRAAYDATALPALPTYEFRTLGDMLEQQAARRPENPGEMRWYGSAPQLLTGAIHVLPVADAVSLAARGSTLINDQLTPAEGESALAMTTRLAAPNFSSTEPMWKWFPLSLDGVRPDAAFKLWYDWSKGFEITTPTKNPYAATPAFVSTTDYKAALLDESNQTAATLANRTFKYTATSSSGLTDVKLPRPLRSLLTTRSGVTNAVAERRDDVDASLTAQPAPLASSLTTLPWGMPAYGTDRSKNEYPAIRVAAATGTKEQLWRAYWSAMTQNKLVRNSIGAGYHASWDVDRDTRATGAVPTPVAYNVAPVPDAFLAPDRHPSRVTVQVGVPNAPQNRLDERQMTLIRSAVAACNTIDLRDSDNDVTAMTVDLGSVSNAANADRLFARVYGTEKQLVITAVAVDCDGDAGSPNDAVVIEIFNPSDEVIDLAGYYLGVEDRPSAGSVTLADGEVKATNPTQDPAGAASRAHLLPLTGPTTLQPGGFLIVSNGPLPAAGPRPAARQTVPPPTPTLGTPVPGHEAILVMPSKDPVANAPLKPSDTTPTQVTYLQNVPVLSGLVDTKRELVLLRTRRADGIAYVEAQQVANANNPQKYPRPVFSEDVATNGGLLSLVPVDAVDFRSVKYRNDNDSGSIAWYMRNTFNPVNTATSAYAWKCFYAGRFYDVRPGSAIGPGNPTNPTNPTTPPAPAATAEPQPKPDTKAPEDWAWRVYPTGTDPGENDRNLAIGTLGAFRQLVPDNGPAAGSTAPPNPYRAPTIPIQKFRPISTFYDPTNPAPINRPSGVVDHAPYRFPYGSPFARNGDVLAVPFIGSYKVYRVPSGFTAATPAAQIKLYDYVPLTMDAVSVAPLPKDCETNPSVGRFDGRDTSSDGVADVVKPRNIWAADLFDFVTARQSSADEMYFPDVPQVAVAVFNDPTLPSSDQDGPVVGVGGALNPQAGVPWVRWQKDGSAAQTSAVRQGAAVAGANSSQLIQGTINLNTAPPIVLRMLPWTVDARPTSGVEGGGRLDQRPTLPGMGATPNPINEEMRRRVAGLNYTLTQQPTKYEGAKNQVAPFGFTSVSDVVSLDVIPSAAGTTSYDPAKDQPLINASTSSSPSSFGTTSVFNLPSSEQSMMRFGMLNPRGRPLLNLDFSAVNLNMTRVSNLVSQRSDCYTVYVTVQAWTWVGDTPTQPDGRVPNQAVDTRLVGERRASFIVDRSRISNTRYKPSDLIVYPIESE